MPRPPKPLVQFNVPYYKYPTSVCRGFWGRYPIDTGLSASEQERRQQWLAAVAKWSQSSFHRIVANTFADPVDDKLLHSLLVEHGLFVEQFFHRRIRERVVRKFAGNRISVEKVHKLLSSARGYEAVIKNRWDAIYHIVDHIYEQTLVRAINDPETYHQLEMWFRVFEESRTCALCGGTFRVIDLPSWVYFGSDGCKTCCFQCPIVATPKKKELTTLIPAFVDVCGFIPNSGADPRNYFFSSRLSPNKKADVFLAYGRMGGVKHVKKKFGSWFEALAETGTLPDGVLVSTRGIRCVAKDSHVCGSLDEQRIDNWLSLHGVHHEREPYYPAHSTLNPTGRRRADWQVGSTFIEYFGLLGNAEYDKKTDEKIFLAQSLGITLIALYPSDLKSLGSKLSTLAGIAA